MSDSEGDIDDELLALAGANEKKRKKRQGHSNAKSSSSKRRKADISMDKDSDDEPESEEEEPNPYPLEGKYINEADRQELMLLSEVDREDILSQRLEEIQRSQDKRKLDMMLNSQSNHNGDLESVSKAAKRQHAVRGATKEKSRKLDELKARRKAQDEKKRTKTNSPKRDRSSSPMDMETSDDEEEDGQITKYEEEEERERKLYGKTEPEVEHVTLEDLNKCRLTRDLLAKYCMAPWFEDYVKGAWVRYLIGSENNSPVYRICEITNLGADLVKPYKINDKTVNQSFELKHGKSTRVWPMDKTSNSEFLAHEFDRLARVCSAEEVKLPSKRQLEQKAAQLVKLPTQPMTESDITAMLARKNQLQAGKPSSGSLTLEKSRLTQARTLALRRQDYTELQDIDEKLAALATSAPLLVEDGVTDMLAKVNERNRKANIEAVRKAEIIEAERKRRERKLAASGLLTPQDPSARLKIVPRTFNAATPSSRSGTPLPAGSGTPGARSVSPMPPAVAIPPKNTFETAVIDSIEVDLGDF